MCFSETYEKHDTRDTHDTHDNRSLAPHPCHCTPNWGYAPYATTVDEGSKSTPLIPTFWLLTPCVCGGGGCPLVSPHTPHATPHTPHTPHATPTRILPLLSMLVHTTDNSLPMRVTPFSTLSMSAENYHDRIPIHVDSSLTPPPPPFACHVGQTRPGDWQTAVFLIVLLYKMTVLLNFDCMPNFGYEIATTISADPAPNTTACSPDPCANQTRPVLTTFNRFYLTPKYP